MRPNPEQSWGEASPDIPTQPPDPVEPGPVPPPDPRDPPPFPGDVDVPPTQPIDALRARAVGGAA